VQQVLSWIRSHQTESVVLVAALAILVGVVVSSQSTTTHPVTTENQTTWLSWQSTSVRMPEGKADLFWVQLAQEQKLEMKFDLSPSTAEISVVVGTIRHPNSPNWSWGYREEEFPRVGDGDTIVFEADHSYDYGIWMKPRLDHTVKATIRYRFST